MKNYRIHKGDSRNTRHAKKQAFNNGKRRYKDYFVDGTHLVRVKRGKFHAVSRRAIKYSKSIETFCNVNMKFGRPSSRFVLRIDKDFSLFTSPSKVLVELASLLHHAKIYRKNPRMLFEGHISFGALYLLDNLSWEIANKRNWVIEKKNFPPEELSILRNLRSIEASIYEDENEYMINEKVSIHRDNPQANQQYRARAKDITDLIEKGIRETSKDDEYKLPLAIHAAIKSTIGEAFDNIQLHTQDAEIGTLCGFYNKIKKEVTILIYNFGDTIADTFREDSVPAENLVEVLRVLNNHTQKKFLNMTGNREFTGENALTLLAIQEGISSKMKIDVSRGHGIMDFVENCFELTEDCEIVIISGQTAIRIDKTYRIKERHVFGRERRILALNKSNDIFEKPDPKFVVNTGVVFNGVLIEAKIPLNHINDATGI